MIHILLVSSLICFYIFYIYFTERNTKEETIHSVIKRNTSINSLREINIFKNIPLKLMQAGIKDKTIYPLIIAAMLALACITFSTTSIVTPIIWDDPQYYEYLFVGIVLSLIGFYYPIIRIDGMIKDRREEFSTYLPDMLDLLVVMTQSGMSIDQAFFQLCEEFQAISKVVSEEISILSAEMSYFLDSSIAFDNLYIRLQSEEIRVFSSTLVQSIKYGTNISDAIAMLAKEAREQQISKVERKAAALPSKLTVPMMIFSLPVLFVFILSPAIMELMGNV